MDHEDYCAEIITQTELLRSGIAGADLSARVPSCPDWNVGQLVRHVGRAHRSIETIVRTRATGPVPEDEPHHLGDTRGEDADALGDWLIAGAEQLVATLRDAGPDTDVWTPVDTGVPGSAFYARRMTHETVVHRADAMLGVGGEFTLEPRVAVDTLDEWMALGTQPVMFEFFPQRRTLLGPDRTIHLHATDTEAEWVFDMTGEVFTWRRAHEKSAVAVRGPVTDLVLAVYRRRTVDELGVEVVGDRPLFDEWLALQAFG